MKTYTKEQLLKKYKGRYINTISTYDYVEQIFMYEVISVKSKICENHNLPEDTIITD